MRPSTALGVLGPLELVKGGTTVGVRAPRQQALLAILALQANRVVSMRQLVDAIWDEDPPVTATTQLYICISGLRRLLKQVVPEELILTRTRGYQLRASPELLDVIRFEQLVSRGHGAARAGRPMDAVQDLRAGLALWRGPAAADVGSRVVQVAATRLNEQRLATLEECLQLELNLGRHAEIVPELAALVAENPLREKLRTYQMLALYRAGRQAEALEVYRCTWRIYVDELGIEPGGELRRLEQAILSNDEALMHDGDRAPVRIPAPDEATTTVPRQLPSDVPDFIGRDDVVHQLRRRLALPAPAEDAARPVRTVVLTGMPGVGKTALAVHVAHGLKHQYPDGQLFVPLRGASGWPAAVPDVLRRCLHAFGAAPEVLPSSAGGLASMYRSQLAEKRVLVLLDDAASAAQVDALLPGGPTCSVIVTSRNRLPDLVGGHFVDVGPLSPDHATALLSRQLKPARPRITEAELAVLGSHVGQLPLGLRIIAAKMLAFPHRPVSHFVDRLADERTWLAELEVGDLKISASILPWYERLSGRARCLLQWLALLGPMDFGPWIAALLDCSCDESDLVLGELVGSSLVEVSCDDGPSIRLRLHKVVHTIAKHQLATERPDDSRVALGRLRDGWQLLMAEYQERLRGNGNGGDTHRVLGHARSPDSS